ncbi:MAG: S8 family serine peptidase [Cyclobacteriaceae bacterium]|nr:S8 family serine peptidase [Cyclobacteriaceae bacterium]
MSALVEVHCARVARFSPGSFAIAVILTFLPYASALAQADTEKYDIVHIKFKKEFLPASNSSENGKSARSGMTSIDLISEKYDAISIERIFTESPKYEKAHEAYGLNLWYKLKFPKGSDTARAISEYKSLNYFHTVEACKPYVPAWDRAAKAKRAEASSLSSGPNDPQFKYQWHYQNTGQNGGVAGADINVMKAWRIETGSPNVIVAVIDGGVDINHPDLKGALWRNPGEIAGNGIDDDHNGYSDDIHGYGFGDHSSNIFPDPHGTHVAGTIGAISNNGVGVAGVAGGNGKADGVRIMSLATFGQFSTGNFENAMIYAADNGAVISQNSWGGGSTAIEAAIDYFIARAGFDNSNANFPNNIQTGPMAGGIVIFAAGNDNKSEALFGYPGSYPKAIAVASTNNADIKAATSNYGNWVDITAPGDRVLSTLPDSDYGYFSGTSMACPHVSGVAALLISFFQQPGLKPNEIRSRLLMATRPIDVENPDYVGKLGSGRLSAYNAFATRDRVPPATITDLRVIATTSTSIKLQWTAPSESGAKGGQVDKYDIRISKTPINELNFQSAESVEAPAPGTPGQIQTCEANWLSIGSTYYIAIKSTDALYTQSALSNVVSTNTFEVGIFEPSNIDLNLTMPAGRMSTQPVELNHIDVSGLNAEPMDLLLVFEGGPVPVSFPQEHIIINKGATQQIILTFNTKDVAPGEYSGLLRGVHREFCYPLGVSIKLTVTPPIGLGIADDVNIGSLLINQTRDTTVLLHNNNTTALIIQTIQTSDPRITLSATAVTLSPGEDYPLTISITGSEAGVLDATLTLQTNDPEDETVSVKIHGEFFEVPEITISPLSITATLSLAEQKNFDVSLTNTGQSSVSWHTNYPATETPAGLYQFTEKASAPADLTALSFDPVGGFIYGKAMFISNFYRYNSVTNSWSALAPGPTNIFGQAAYLNGKIYHTGQKLEVYTVASNSWSSINYPVAVSCQTITTDGQYLYLAFGKVLYRYDILGNSWLQLTTFTGGYSSELRSLNYWNGIILAADHSGLTGDGNTPLYKYFVNSNTWVRSANLKGKITSSAAIDPVGEKYIVFQSVGSGPGTAFDVRNLRENSEVQRTKTFSSESSSLIYVDNPGYTGIYATNGNKFYRYQTGVPSSSWLYTTPALGEIPAGSSQIIRVKVGSPTLEPGIHHADVKILMSNGAVFNHIPVAVTVANGPHGVLNSTSGTVEETAVGSGRISSPRLQNTGSSNLIVSSVTIDDPNFSISPSTFSVPPSEFLSLPFLFKPLTSGTFTGTFILHTNDPDNPDFHYTLTGKGVQSAIPQTSPSSITATIAAGDHVTENIHINNPGESSLYLSLGSDFPWITKPSEEYIIQGGQSAVGKVILNASNKTAGQYQGVANLFYLDFAIGSSYLEIPVTMNVTDAPGIRCSVDSVDFKSRVPGNTYDSTIAISNTGSLPLSITDITSTNPAFSISATFPITLNPGEKTDATITFDTSQEGFHVGTVSILSNDPTDAILTLPIKGLSIAQGQLVASVTQIHESALTDQSKSQGFQVSNLGSDEISWRLSNVVDDFATFTALENTPNFAFIALAADSQTGMIYGQSPRLQNLYQYNPTTNAWAIAAGRAPGMNSFSAAEAVVLNGKMYCSFDSDIATIYVYDVSLKEWTRSRNVFNNMITAACSDDDVIYFASGDGVKMFNPSLSLWTTLPSSPLNNIDNLQFFNGNLYAHTGQTTAFARYNVVNHAWEVLQAPPTQFGRSGSMNRSAGRYYSISADGKKLLEYDLRVDHWAEFEIPLFPVTNGTIVYTGSNDIYFTQGDNGVGLGKYSSPVSNIEWLRVSPTSGTLHGLASNTLKLEFNSVGLNSGRYEAMIDILSSGSQEPAVKIPVTFDVTYPGPDISVPQEITGNLDRFASISKTLRIENKGGGLLTWSVDSELPAALTLSKSTGTVAPGSFEEITVHYVSGFYSPRIFSYPLTFSSDDQFSPSVETQLSFITRAELNSAPYLNGSLEDQSVQFGAPPIEISIAELFLDSENDPINYSVISSNSQVASVDLEGTTLKLLLFKTGISNITIIASDDLNASGITEFSVSVNELVTGVEPGIWEKRLRAFPNPFNEQFNIRYDVSQASYVKIQVFDSNGKMVLNSDRYIEVTGENTISIKANQLSPGIYHCRLNRANGETATVRLLKK